MAPSVMLDRILDRDPPNKPTFHTGKHSVPSRRDLRYNVTSRPGKGAAGPDWLIDDLRELPTVTLRNRLFRTPV